MDSTVQAAGAAVRPRRSERRLATIRVGPTKQITVSAIEASGRQIVEIRKWFLRDGAWRADDEHVTVPESFVGEIIGALAAAAKADNRP